VVSEPLTLPSKTIHLVKKFLFLLFLIAPVNLRAKSLQTCTNFASPFAATESSRLLEIGLELGERATQKSEGVGEQYDHGIRACNLKIVNLGQGELTPLLGRSGKH